MIIRGIMKHQANAGLLEYKHCDTIAVYLVTETATKYMMDIQHDTLGKRMIHFLGG